MKVLYYGIQYYKNEIYVLLKYENGKRESILWTKKRRPPKQKWWNTGKEKWIDLAEILK